jgi:hypothetical protein
MKAVERVSNALNIPLEQADVTITALQAALEINRKRRSFIRVANILEAIVVKKSTAQYNQNDVTFARDWIAHQPIRRYIVNGKTSKSTKSKEKTTIPDDSKVSKTGSNRKHRK